MREEQQDMLVELSTKMGFLIDAVNKLEKTFSERITSIEQGKMDRTEFNRVWTDMFNTSTDHEKRVRALEDKSNKFLGMREIVAIVFSTASALIITAIGAFIETHK